MQKSTRLKVDFFNRISNFFNTAERYWHQDFNMTPKCCEDGRITDESQIEVSNEKLRDDNKAELTFGDIEKSSTRKKYIFKTKLSFRDIIEIEANRVEGKYRKEESNPDFLSSSQKPSRHSRRERDSPLWTKEEDRLLVKLCHSRLRKKWKQIAQIIGTKSPTQCTYRYKKLKNSNSTGLFPTSSEDCLFTDAKIREFFDKNEPMNLDSLENTIKMTHMNSDNTQNSSNNNKFFEKNSGSTVEIEDPYKVSKPSFQNDTLDFPDFFEGHKSNSFSNEFLESNAKIINNKSESAHPNPYTHKDSGNIFDVYMRKDSPDVFLLNNKSNSRDKGEFQAEFQRNFGDGKDHDFILKDNDFRLGNTANTLTQINTSEPDIILINIEKYLKSNEFGKSDKKEESNNIFNKMTKYLAELNGVIASRGEKNKEKIAKALELQTILLTSMINLTQLRLNEE